MTRLPRQTSRALIAAVTCCAGVLASPAGHAEDTAGPQLALTPSGQVLARFRHHEGHDFLAGGVADTVRQRTRLGLALAWGDAVSAFVQLQDVRTWGEEGDTLNDFSADGLDLHQGYLTLPLAEGMALRVGRQEVGYLNQRLIGAVGWMEQARAFDAVRWLYAAPDASVTADLLYARTRHDAASDFGGATDLLAGFFQYRVAPAFVPALIAVIDVNGPAERTRVTAGLHATGAFDFGLGYSLEGYYQGGSAQGDVSYAAWFAALHARYTLAGVSAKPWFELFGELASGDDDPTDTDKRAFDTLFATNHKFYGEMDFFVNLPVHTAQRGLLDLGAAAGFAPHEAVDVALTGHLFAAADDQGADGSFGTEFDLKATWTASRHLTLDLVYAVFLPGDGLTGGAADTHAEHFVYATVDAHF